MVSQHVSALEIATKPASASGTNKRQKSTEQQDIVVPGDSPDGTTTGNCSTLAGAPPMSQQQLKQPPPLANHSMEIQRLNQQLQQYHQHNVHLQQSCANGSKRILHMQHQIRTLTENKAVQQREIAMLQDQKKKLVDYGNQHQAEARSWRAKAEELELPQNKNTNNSNSNVGIKIETPSTPSREAAAQSEVPSSSSSSSNTNTNTPSKRETDNLRHQVKVYKSRSEFYMKEAQSKKKQIETLMEEKSRFEDRIRELENAQLCTLDESNDDTSNNNHGGNLMQF